MGDRRRIAQAFGLVEVEEFSPLEAVIFQLAMDTLRQQFHDQRERYRRNNDTQEMQVCDRGLIALAEIERKLLDLSPK